MLTVSEHSSWRAALPGMQDQLERVRAAQRAKFLQTWNGGDGLVGREQRWQAPSLTEGDSVSQRLTHAGLEGSLVSTVQGSCVDPRFPPWAAVQGTAGGAGGWHTTGLFPQDLVLAFSQPVVITKIELETAGIRELRISSCTGEGGDGARFDELTSHTYDAQGRTQQRTSALQQHAFAVPALRTQQLMLTLVSGNGDFCSVQAIEVWGRPAPSQQQESPEHERSPNRCRRMNGLNN